MPTDIDAKLECILTAQARIEERLDNTNRRVDELRKLTESVQSLALSTQAIAGKQDALSTSFAALRNDVDDLKTKPAKRWDSAVTVVITVVITAVATFLLAKAGITK